MGRKTSLAGDQASGWVVPSTISSTMAPLPVAMPLTRIVMSGVLAAGDLLKAAIASVSHAFFSLPYTKLISTRFAGTGADGVFFAEELVSSRCAFERHASSATSTTAKAA